MGRGGGVVIFVAYVTIDHASLSRRSSVPTPYKGHLQLSGAQYVSSTYYIYNTGYVVCLISSLVGRPPRQKDTHILGR